MPEHFDFAVTDIFADTAARTIRGLVVPSDETLERHGRTWRFMRDSIRWGRENSPLLMMHDSSRPVGRLTTSTWTDRGLECAYAVSRTVAGDEALQLANDRVLSFSIGLDVDPGGAKQNGTEYHVTAATAAETSLTPLAAFANASVDHVSLSSEGSAMPDTPVGTPPTTPPPVPTLSGVAAPAPDSVVTFSADQVQFLLAGGNPQNVTPPTGPTVVPVAPVSVTQQPLYRFDGHRAEHCFTADIIASTRGDNDARARLDQYLETFAVSTTTAPTLNVPPNRPDMWQGPLHWGNRPLASLITTGGITDGTPWVFPKWVSGVPGVHDHVEGVEPTADADITATSQTVTPTAIDGLATLTREVIDAGGSPQVDQLVWSEMTAAYDLKLETRVATLLNAYSPPVSGYGAAIAVVGTDDTGVDSLDNALLALQWEKGGARFNSFGMNQALYSAIISARDADGRALVPRYGASVNSDGSAAPGFGAVSVGGKVGVPAYALSTYSFLLVKSSVYQWNSSPRKLTMDYRVASIDVGLWGYEAHAITRATDVRRVTYAAS